jgi:hypothetical protein
VKRRSDEPNELHRRARKIETKRPEQGRKTLPEKHVSDLGQNQESKDPEDQPIGKLIGIPVFLLVVLDSTT